MSEKTPTRLNIVLLNRDNLTTQQDKAESITKNPIGSRNEKGEKGPPLSPEGFKMAQNNFRFFFFKDDNKKLNIGRIYRKKIPFQQWYAANTEKVQRLVDELGTYQFRRWYIDREANQIYNLPDNPRGPEMERKLYESYLHIREYVDDDRTLFI